MDAVNDPQGVRAADALLEVREEGGRGGGGCEAQTAEALSIEIIRHAFPVN